MAIVMVIPANPGPPPGRPATPAGPTLSGAVAGIMRELSVVVDRCGL